MYRGRVGEPRAMINDSYILNSFLKVTFRNTTTTVETSKKRTTSTKTTKQLRVGALVQWLWEMTHAREVMGSNPGAVYWMDLTFFHIDLLLKIMLFVRKDQK